MGLDNIELRVLNWDRLNEKRKDVTNPSWLRLENSLPQSESLFGLTAAERYVFISIICLASKKQTDTLKFRADWFIYWAGACFTQEELFSALKKLDGACIEVVRNVDVTPTLRECYATNGRTNETNGRNVTNGSREKNFADPPVGGSLSETGGADTWAAYALAFARRYGEQPPRNAKSNSLCKQLVKRLGALEAPEVAQFYVSHNGDFYQNKGHPLTLLVADAEKLRTEWKTGKVITPKTPAQRNIDSLKTMFQKVERGEL